MPNKIDDCFARLRAEKRKAFIPYICAGDPNLQTTVDLVGTLEKAGADLVELGVPFSDPLADGIVNQLAAQRALKAGATVRGVLECARQIRAQSTIPIVLYTYLNPILQFGFENFHREAANAGVDALLVLDLPPDEEGSSGKLGEVDSTLIHIRLIAPTTPVERIKQIVARAKGFLYYVSREGVTGARGNMASSLGERLAELRKLSDLPVAVGFGISNPQQATEVAQLADAVVVGSAIVNLIAQHVSREELMDQVGKFASELAAAVHSPNR